MGGTALFTVIAKNYLAHARQLMRSAAAQHPDWRRFVILVDRVDGYFDPAAEDFELILSTGLSIPESRWFHFKYSILELSTAVKPYAFEHLFRLHGFDRIVYLDPDIRIYSPLSRVTELLQASSIVLTPHLTAALEDGKRPSEIDILRSGSYNLGFIAVTRCAASSAFLCWWQQRLFDHCLVDLPRGLFVDQRWVDLVPGLFENVAILRDPGYNVAYWNLSHRPITRSPGGYEVAGAPLAFFHFSGYDVDHPEKVSKHQNRHEMPALPPVVRQIFHDYGQQLLAEGLAACRNWPQAYSYFENGTGIPDMCRPIHHEEPELARSVADPFSDEGFKLFVEVWNRPIQEHAGRPGISRLAYRIYRTRTDVQAAMPDIFGGHYFRFLEWLLNSGRLEHGVGDAFLTTITAAARTYRDHRESLSSPDPLDEREGVDGTSGEAPADGTRLHLTRLAAAIYNARPELQRTFPDPRGRDRARFLVWLLTYGRQEYQLSTHHVAILNQQWRAVLDSLPGSHARLRHQAILAAMGASLSTRGLLSRARSVVGLFHNGSQRTQTVDNLPYAAPSELAVAAPPEPESAEFGVNLVGYFRSETGVGESVRAACGALRSVSVPLSLRAAEEAGYCQARDRSVGPMSAEFPYSTNLIHVNADQAAHVASQLGGRFFRNRHNIGYWAWELEEFPDRWSDAFSYYHELWTPSEFCSRSIRQKSPIPVHAIPHAVSPVVSGSLDRQHFGFKPGQFVFLTAFDVLSVIERKNPLASIRAFLAAFGSNPDCQLVVKVNNAATAPREHRRVLESVASACASPNIRIFDATLSRNEMHALTQCADCIVSLHRSEGFGLHIAEAMYFGKPTIVTNYSGNVDFTRRENSMLVDFRLIPVGQGCLPYDENSRWADPAVEQAASHMRTIVAEPDLRTRLSAAASTFVRTNLSPAAVGQLMRERLEAIAQAHASAGFPSTSTRSQPVPSAAMRAGC
ncbi:glycosyltransferase family 4 protein [Paludibaculum fermentans]|uniref:Glycosyltransferase family 4 protein n=1 Tax=Paludibaculum fermentans TaxID=1473598 RepID=A0A7S7SK32_PALFE|nr:glycosyltransferase family 4 protein [Paludibaculum fermentans]QOY88717.1 glycosyltransferase family 4 protein [Paludibaculum fermentans]